MKTRIVQTDFYRKMAKWKAPKDVRLLYKYTFDNEYINMCGIYELPDEYILLETGLKPKELEKAKVWLAEKKKVFFYQGWIFVTAAEEHNSYKNSPKNLPSYEKELASVPQHIKEYFDSSITNSTDSSIATTSDTNHKSKIINKKPEIINHKPEGSLEYLKNLPETDLEEFYQKFETSKRQIQDKAISLANYCEGHGKTYKNYRAMLLNALMKDFGRKRQVYAAPAPVPDLTPEQIQHNSEKIAEIRNKPFLKKFP